MPRQVNYNGVVHNFPDGTTDDEVRSALSGNELVSKDDGSQQFHFDLDSLKRQGRLTVKNAGSGLAMLGGIAGGVPGAAAGAMLGKGVQKLFPGIMQEQSPLEDVGDVAGNTVMQGVVPQVVGNMMRFGAKGAAAMFPGAMNLPGVKIAQLINKAKGYMMPESSLLETAASNAADQSPKIAQRTRIPSNDLVTPSGDPAMITQTKSSPVYDTPAGRMISKVEDQAPAFQKITPAAKEIMSDIQSVRNAKLATGNPTLVRQIAANDLVTRNYSKAADTINPTAILDEIGKRPDVYEEAFGKPALDSFTQLMQTAQDKGVGKTTDLISWREGRKALYLSLPAHALGVPIDVAESIVLGVDAIKKVATNPQLGQMLLQAAKTNANAPEATLLQKAIVNGLRGATLYIKRADGSKEKFDTSSPQ